MSIHQGDIYWVQLDATAGIPHPHVIIQTDATSSGSGAVAACALTSNLKRVSLPGNVLLEAGEANLPKASVVEVSKVVTLDRAQLGAYIGTLSQRRVEQVLAGIRFLDRAFFTDTDADG